MPVIRLLSTLNERRKPPMSNNYRELTGRGSSGSKAGYFSLCQLLTKSTAACHWIVTVQCWVSALPTAHYADISASLSCRKMQDWKPYSRKYRPLIVNNAASRSQLTGKRCTAHSAVPKKLAVSRQQQGCEVRRNNRCNAFPRKALCRKAFEGISVLAGCEYLLLDFNHANGYTPCRN